MLEFGIMEEDAIQRGLIVLSPVCATKSWKESLEDEPARMKCSTKSLVRKTGATALHPWLDFGNHLGESIFLIIDIGFPQKWFEIHQDFGWEIYVQDLAVHPLKRCRIDIQKVYMNILVRCVIKKFLKTSVKMRYYLLKFAKFLTSCSKIPPIWSISGINVLDCFSFEQYIQECVNLIHTNSDELQIQQLITDWVKSDELFWWSSLIPWREKFELSSQRIISLRWFVFEHPISRLSHFWIHCSFIEKFLIPFNI
jgi:hypothetical protein